MSGRNSVRKRGNFTTVGDVSTGAPTASGAATAASFATEKSRRAPDALRGRAEEGAGDAHVVVVGRADVHHQVGGFAQPVPAGEGVASPRRQSVGADDVPGEGAEYPPTVKLAKATELWLLERTKKFPNVVSVGSSSTLPRVASVTSSAPPSRNSCFSRRSSRLGVRFTQGQGVAVHAHCTCGVRGQDHAAAAAGANRPV